jgi:hypothetical protein
LAVVVAVIPFTIAVGPNTGTRPIQEVTDFQSWTLDNNLDDGCSISFQTRGDSIAASLIDELATDVWLYRGPILVQRFRVTSVEQTWDADGNDDVTVVATCYRRLLRKSHVRSELVFTGIAQDQIILDLIQHAQAATGGSLGITAGSLTSGTLRDRIYPQGTNIFTAIVEFTQIDNGVEWNVNADLELDVRDRLSLPLQPMPVQLGVTARSLTRPSTAEQFGNAAIAIGNPENTDAVIAEDAGLPTDPRGRWERFVSVTADTQQEVQDLADGLIEQAVSPLSTWIIQMEPDRYFSDAEYDIGEQVTIIQPRSTVFAIGTPAPRLNAQIISRQITQTADGEVQVTVTAIEVLAP